MTAKKKQNQTDETANETDSLQEPQLSPSECDELKQAGIDDPQAFIGSLLQHRGSIAAILKILARILEGGT